MYRYLHIFNGLLILSTPPGAMRYHPHERPVSRDENVGNSWTILPRKSDMSDWTTATPLK